MMETDNGKKTNYHTLFIMGIIFTGAGIAIGLGPMMFLGLIFMFIGLLNRNKWPDEGKIQDEK